MFLKYGCYYSFIIFSLIFKIIVLYKFNLYKDFLYIFFEKVVKI